VWFEWNPPGQICNCIYFIEERMRSVGAAEEVPLEGLAVSASARGLLRSAGLRSVEEVQRASAAQLARGLRTDVHAVGRALKELRDAIGSQAPQGKSALEMLRGARRDRRSVVTFCRALDEMLDGGVRLGAVTEFCGVPGCGKTQMCIQLCIDVTIPEEFAGLGSEALYIDTEGSFAVERMYDMAEAIVQNLTKVVRGAKEGDEELRKKQEEAIKLVENDPLRLMEKVHVMRVYNQAEQIATVMKLDRFLSEHPAVKIVVIDSVAFHFRQDSTNSGQRARALAAHAQNLNAMAAKHNVAVVVTNQMTVKFGNSTAEKDNSYYAPALGESWSHAITNRILLERLEEVCRVTFKKRKISSSEAGITSEPEETTIRVARLLKSPYLPNSTAQFVVRKTGIRDLPPR